MCEVTADVLLWCAAGRGIGLGHLMEGIALAEALTARGARPAFLVPADPAAAEILAPRPWPWQAAEGDAALAAVAARPPAVVVVDHRRPDLDLHRALADLGCPVAVIDQLGGAAVAADLLVNPSPVADWQTYEVHGPAPRHLRGPAHALLRPDIRAAAAAPPWWQRRRQPNILVTMGGVDRTGATLRVVAAAAALDPSPAIEVVVGAGFPHLDRLRALDVWDRPERTLDRAVPDLGARIRQAGLVVCAGGNTLYEIAHLESAAVVLWEDPHEEVMGRAFAEAGAARLVGNGLETPLEAITETLAGLVTDPDACRALGRAGRHLVDGQGADRVAAEILALADGGGYSSQH